MSDFLETCPKCDNKSVTWDARAQAYLCLLRNCHGAWRKSEWGYASDVEVCPTCGYRDVAKSDDCGCAWRYNHWGEVFQFNHPKNIDELKEAFAKFNPGDLQVAELPTLEYHPVISEEDVQKLLQAAEVITDVLGRLKRPTLERGKNSQ